MIKAKKDILSKLYIVAFVLFVFAVTIIGKMMKIQIVDGDKYKEMAEKRTIRSYEIPADNGNIYDSKGNLLATSVPKYTIRFDAVPVKDKLFADNINALSDSLAIISGKPNSHFERLLKESKRNKSRYTLILRDLGYLDYLRVKNFPIFNKGPFKGGFIAEKKVVRERPLGGVAARTIGSDDERGRVGIEGAYWEYLRGQNGRRIEQKIGQRQWKPLYDMNEVEPQDGLDVVSTIDITIQDIVHNALLEQLEQYEADHGCAIVMETSTGEIKGISNLKRTSEGKYYEARNYAVFESQEPGSTFKLMSMVAALEDKVVDTSQVIPTGNGKMTFFGKYDVKDSNYLKGGHGDLSVSEVFEVSSNVGIVKIIYNNYKKRPEDFVNRLYNMGLNEKLGVKIKGEGQPRIPHPDDSHWSGTSLPWMAWGYEVKMTPLQILTYYNAIANNGEMLRPRFVKEVDKWGESIVTYEKDVLKSSICSKSTINIVKNMMERTVKKGTASNIYSKELKMAGKTGTCKGDYNKKDKEMYYVSSFVGYFPADNPKYSCMVVVNKPNKKIGYYGATVAAPGFRKIAQEIYSLTPEVVKETKEVLLVDEEIEAYHDYFKKTEKYKTIVPNVKGMTLMDAVALLENMGLNVQVKGSGRVKSQSIAHGQKISKNKTIVLELS